MPDDVLIQLITTAGLIIVAIVGNRKLNRIGGDAKEAREQTANTHSTNLRDDIDDIAQMVRGQGRHLARIDEHLADLHAEDESIEATLTTRAGRMARTLADQQNALSEAIARHDSDMARIPQMIADATLKHIRACPLRTPTPATPRSPH